MTRVLIVDDEPQLLRTLVLILTNHNFHVSTAADGMTALKLIDGESPDLVLLDLGLPDLDGLEIIRRVRRTSPELPIIVLSARSGSNDKIVALDLGAVDYVTKPFDVHELLARLRAVARRRESTIRSAQATETVSLGAITVDLAAHLITSTAANGERDVIHLTPTEWRLLETLLEQPGSLVGAPELLTAMRGAAGHTESSYLRIYMSQLRHKLEAEPSRPRYLLTEPGMGYRYQP